MKWGVVILVLVLLLSFIFVDEWRGLSLPGAPKNESAGKQNLSERKSFGRGDQRTVEELLTLMRENEDRWFEAGVAYDRFPAKRWEVVRSWTLAEVEALCRSEEGYDWSNVLFERWGQEVPDEALAFVLGLQKKYAQEYIKAQNSLEGGEAVAEDIGMIMNSVLAGWSRVDPQAAWKAASNSNGLTIEGEVFEDHGYLWNAPIQIFEHLSKRDPDFAFEEFLRQEDPMFQGSMLKGMARGLPASTDWAEFMGGIISTENVEHRDIMAVLRGGLLGRWMEVNAKEAEKWFRGDEGITISRKVEETVERQWPDPFRDNYNEAITKVEVTDISLASAVRHWASNDKEGAMAWLTERSELVPEILGGENWLDPDDLKTSDSREILVACYPAEKREALLKGYLDREEVFHSPLNRLFEASTRKHLRKEIAELVVSEEIAEQIFQSISKARQLNDDGVGGATESDPFSNE